MPLIPLPLTVTWLLWLAAISVWMEAVLPPSDQGGALADTPPPTASADVVDLRRWRLDHPANENGRWSA